TGRRSSRTAYPHRPPRAARPARRPGTRRAGNTWARCRRSSRRTGGTSPGRAARSTRAAGGPRPRRAPPGSAPASEESELLGRVADQQVLGLLVVIQHLGMVLPADPGLLVPAERRMRRISVVAVRPHAARLDTAAEAVSGVGVAGPHPGTQ